MNFPRPFASSALLSAGLVLAGCGNPFGGTLCTASVEPAVVVEIRDARTGAALASGASGTVTDGAFADSLRPYQFQGAAAPTLISRRAADERPGVYAVAVTHPGYQTWAASGVRAGRDDCHVQTRRLQAELQPAS